MRTRPTARLLVTDSAGRVLLFKFAHRGGALDGVAYWATPGGGVEAHESVEQAALRELREETGYLIAPERLGAVVAVRDTVFTVDSGEQVRDIERFFHVRVDGEGKPISTAGWTAYERECMCEARWWSRIDLAQSAEVIWPQDLCALLASLPDAPTAP